MMLFFELIVYVLAAIGMVVPLGAICVYVTTPSETESGSRLMTSSLR